MAGVSKVIVFFCASLSLTVWAHPNPAPPPQKNDSQPEPPNFGNLKYTFGSKEEIPSAFFDTEPLKNGTGNVVPTVSTSTPSDSSPPAAIRFSRRVYPACQDGSGGMCVDAGTCPSDKKPDTSNPDACASGQECCFGAPTTDRTCGSRGGECMPVNQCGSAPRFEDAEDCDQRNGQICCILI